MRCGRTNIIYVLRIAQAVQYRCTYVHKQCKSTLFNFVLLLLLLPNETDDNSNKNNKNFLNNNNNKFIQLSKNFHHTLNYIKNILKNSFIYIVYALYISADVESLHNSIPTIFFTIFLTQTASSIKQCIILYIELINKKWKTGNCEIMKIAKRKIVRIRTHTYICKKK